MMRTRRQRRVIQTNLMVVEVVVYYYWIGLSPPVPLDPIEPSRHVEGQDRHHMQVPVHLPHMHQTEPLDTAMRVSIGFRYSRGGPMPLFLLPSPASSIALGSKH